MSSPPRWWPCVTRGRCARKSAPWPRSSREEGYNTTCVGFSGNPSSRGFDTYLDYPGWGSWNEGRSPKAREPQRRRHPGAGTAGQEARALLPLPAPHGPARALSAARALRAHVLPRQRDRPATTSRWSRSWRSSPSATSSPVGCRRASPTRTMSSPSTTARSPTWTPASSASSPPSRALGIAEQHHRRLNGDHGETLYDHECWFDHHGMYDPTLLVPLIIRYPGTCARGQARATATTSTRTWCPRCWSWPSIERDDIAVRRPQPDADGARRGRLPSRASSTSPSAPGCASTAGARRSGSSSCALEPDFHFKPAVELYNLVEDPEEN